MTRHRAAFRHIHVPYPPIVIIGLFFMFFSAFAIQDANQRLQDNRTQAATQCGKLQDLINAAPSGSTVLVPACVYRESVMVAKPLILDGQGQAEIRGSDIWTAWTKTGTTWVSTQTVPAFPTISGHCSAGTNDDCQRAEQVYINGVSLKQLASTDIPSAGQFSVNSTRHVVLGDDPTGRTVEVTTRRYWLQVGAPNVTVKNFTMKHAAVDAQDGALQIKNVGNVTIQNYTLS